MNWFGNNLWLVYSKEFEGELCKACVLFDPVENNVNRGIFAKRVFRDFSKPEKTGSMLKQYYNLRAQEFQDITKTTPLMSTTM